MKEFIGCFMAFLLIYFLFAFVNWETNPANWSMDVRMCAAIIGLAWSITTVGYIKSLKQY